jgi:hypothetical protein
MTTLFPHRPVSAALESELRTMVRKHGVVVWLDKDAHYTALVDELIEARRNGALPYAVFAWRGSHLALLMALDGIAAGTERVPLVVHMPGFIEETVSQTPLLELYEVGFRLRKGLDTLVTEAAAGRVRPDEIAAFKRQPQLTLAAADAWLNALESESAQGLSGQLRAMQPTALVDALLEDGPIARELTEPEHAATLWVQLNASLGLPDAWRNAALTSNVNRLTGRDVAFAAASWALCVEYVHDLSRQPVSQHLSGVRSLPDALVANCSKLATYLRKQHAVFYQRTADETETLLADEVEAADAKDLGKVDTFRFEEDKVLKGAISALAARDFKRAADWASARLGSTTASPSFWLNEDPARNLAWQLVAEAAKLGTALVRAGERAGVSPNDSSGLEAVVNGYVERGAAVDQAHRHLEQRRRLLNPRVPEFETLRAQLDALRQAWRTWADSWARDFNAICRTQGFLPGSAMQQRMLFEQVVRPFTTENDITAYFVVDALRFEMGEELFREFAALPATTAHLRPRLAELPTVTEVGMNLLAPVEKQGRVTPVIAADLSSIQAFRFGDRQNEFRVSDPDTRKRAMHDRTRGATCPWLTLDEVNNRDLGALKRTVAQARLVVVHSREIDEAGESGAGLAVFDQVLRQLASAWRLLRDAGVRRFVFTSDHGFLLLDDTVVSAQSHGRIVDPKRRYVLTRTDASASGEVRVSMSALGYEDTDAYLIFPESTAVFDTGRRTMGFVHGGNSLQERVIPVITVVHRGPAGGNTQQYRISAVAKDPVSGMHCLRATVEVVAQGSLDFGSTRHVDLALSVADAQGVQVEICQVLGGAKLSQGVVAATVGAEFELFFRLSGATDARVLVELHHPGNAAEVVPYTLETRFGVTATQSVVPGPVTATADKSGAPGARAWLEQYADPGVRQVLEHIAVHGVITEREATGMLGNPRAMRQFAIKFDDHASKAPFSIRIESAGGEKRYVREGTK